MANGKEFENLGTRIKEGLDYIFATLEHHRSGASQQQKVKERIPIQLNQSGWVAVVEFFKKWGVTLFAAVILSLILKKIRQLSVLKTI